MDGSRGRWGAPSCRSPRWLQALIRAGRRAFLMSNFGTIDRETGFLLPPSVDEWLPEKHLARFVVEVVDGLDLRAMSGSYRGSGSASYHPRMLLGILVYGYATGVFSSRKLERATYKDSGGVPVHRGQRSSRPRHDRDLQRAPCAEGIARCRGSRRARAGGPRPLWRP